MREGHEVNAMGRIILVRRLIIPLSVSAVMATAQAATDADVIARMSGAVAASRNVVPGGTGDGTPDKEVNVLSLEGRPAPHVEGRLHLGPRVPSAHELEGKIVLLFFWAHWCPDCKADSPSVANLFDKYRSEGLRIIAPTRRYGLVGGGRPAAPDKELRYLIDVRNTHYSFLRGEPVPVSDVNYEAYGITSIPTYVLIDRHGTVRRYHPGRLTEEELEAAIRKLL
jgi:thiol-disulfide isomerase/thioredoxin